MQGFLHGTGIVAALFLFGVGLLCFFVFRSVLSPSETDWWWGFSGGAGRWPFHMGCVYELFFLLARCWSGKKWGALPS